MMRGRAFRPVQEPPPPSSAGCGRSGGPARGALCLALLLACGGLLWPLAAPTAAQQSEADVFVAQAILAYDARRYDEALGLLREALSQDPNNVEALYYTGLVYMAQQRTEAAVQALEKARALSPQDFSIRFLLGVAYFSLERYDEAEPLLTQCFAERPQTEGLGYYVGLMRYRKKDYQGALRAFRAETSTNPNIQQLVKFYSGLTLAILGLPEQAVAEVNAALQVQSGSALIGPAERIRDSISSARQAERRFHANLRLGFFYDSNVAVLPIPSSDPTAETVRNAFDPKTSGELIALRLEYAWLRTGPWDASIAYSFFQTFNNGNSDNSLAAFNTQDNLVELNGSYRGAVGAMPYQLGAQFTYDYLTLGAENFLQRYSGTVFATLVEDGTNLSTVLGRYRYDHFTEPGALPQAASRSGSNWMLGLSHLFRFSRDRHYIRIGYQLDIENALGRNFDYVGQRGLAGFQYTLPWNSTRVRFDIDLHYRNFLHADTLLPTDNPGSTERQDLEQNYVLRIEQDLVRNFGPAKIGCTPVTPCPLTFSVEWQHILNRSNLALFSYNRDVLSLILSWQY